MYARAALLTLIVVAGTAAAQAPSSELSQKQLAMLVAEVQFFSTLAREQKDEIDKLKTVASNPCADKDKP